LHTHFNSDSNSGASNCSDVKNGGFNFSSQEVDQLIRRPFAKNAILLQQIAASDHWHSFVVARAQVTNKRASMLNGRSDNKITSLLAAASAVAFLMAAGLAASEFGAVLYVKYWNGRWAWSPDESLQHTAPVTEEMAMGPTVRLNPFYGYTPRPGIRFKDLASLKDAEPLGQYFIEKYYPTLKVNNYGFLDLRDFPYRDETGRTFIIGVFGASVAAQFALTMDDKINKLLTDLPQMQGKQVALLDFTGAGFHQPQQAVILAYFLSLGQKFDYIINVDGFSEIFIGWHNAHEHLIDERMPFARYIFGVQNILQSAGDADETVFHLRLQANDLERKLKDRQLALLYLWREVERRRIQSKLAALEERLSKRNANGDYAMPLLPRSSSSEQQMEANIVSSWFNGSLTMASLAKGLGVPYLHVLHPNQYFTKAKFTEEQRQAFLNLEVPPVKTIAPEYYRAFLALAPDLESKGVDFLDATGLFDGGDGSVFRDNCCHMTSAANELMATAIAARIRKRLSPVSTDARVLPADKQ
jgi:hypothetical protein